MDAGHLVLLVSNGKTDIEEAVCAWRPPLLALETALLLPQPYARTYERAWFCEQGSETLLGA